MSVPTYTLKRVKTDVERMYEFHKGMTKLTKEMISKMHTKELEGAMQNFSLLMSGNYGDEKTVEFPVDIIRETALFASLALSRLLWERYKLEKTLGRSVVDREPNIPATEDLTKSVSEGTIEETETPETENVQDNPS